jgi:type IV secretory pathway VirB4 component
MPLTNDFGNVLDIVNVKDVRQGTVVLKSGGMRQIVMVGGTNFSLKSEEEQNVITQSYQNFLNSINFPVQIIVHSRKINIEHYIARLGEYRTDETIGLLQDQIGEYQEFVRGFIKDNPIMAKSFFVVVPYVPVTIPGIGSGGASSLLSSLPFGSKKPEEKKKTADEQAQAEQTAFQEAQTQLKQRVTEVIQGLSTIGIDAVALNDEQIVELFYNFYNPETVEKKEVAVEKKK